MTDKLEQKDTHDSFMQSEDVLTALGCSVAVAALASIGVFAIGQIYNDGPATVLGLAEIVFLSAIWWLTKRNRALRASVKRAEQTHQSDKEIFQASGEGIVVHDKVTGRIIEANEAALKLLGFTPENADEFALSTLTSPGSEYSLNMLHAHLLGATRTPARFEWTTRSLDGRTVWLDVTVRSALIEGKECVVAILHDTTEQRKLQEQFQQSENLRVVGQLASGVAQDFSNQLTVISANASLLETSLASQPELAEYARDIVDSSLRSTELTQQLLVFARKSELREELIDVDALVAKVVKLLKRSIDSGIEIAHECSVSPACVKGDPMLLQNAVLNLGLNARDSMLDGGFLRITVSTSDEGEGGQVHLWVEDTGCGMSQEVQQHIFEPFYMTRSEGTGMGMAAVYGTVAAHHGTIDVESTLGQGSCFVIKLPIVREALESLEAAPKKKLSEKPFEGLRVLLVEDDSMVAVVMTQMLSLHGCEVTHCEDGQYALEEMQNNGGYDIAFLDCSMPRMNGPATLQALREQGFEIPVIAMSGHSDAHEEFRLSADQFIAKPFTMSTILHAVEKAMEKDIQK